MAPALTKVLNDDRGIHLSSPPGSVLSNSNGTVVRTELDPHLMLTEDVDVQKMWLNVSLFSALDSCVPMSLDVPAIPALSPYMQASASQYETVSSPSPSSLLGLLSFNKGLSDSHQGASVLSGVSDMLLGLTPEHSSQEACLQCGCGDAPECGPDGVDVHQSSLTHASLVKSQDNTHIFATSPTVTQEKQAGMGCLSAAKQHCNDRLTFDPLTPRASVEEHLKEQLSRQARLHSRAWGLQKRLEATLAEHTVLHCDQQLEGLKRHSQLEVDSLDYMHSGLVSPQAENKPNFSWLDLSTASSSLTELREFCCSNQAVLRSLQESFDSDATASSSSDEELGERWRYSKTKRTLPVSSSSYERQWLEERAELGSRWSWLQLRLAELEGRIQQLVELHKHIRSSKSGVVLAEPHPLKDRKTRQNLLREMGGYSCTATDADTEPCSPMRLLHNIERQSAQLSQIVNSLMPPLSFSPLSKQAQAWKERSSIKRGQKADNGVMPGSSKRRKLGSRMLFKADVSCVCARTRPLVAYCKPRLFTFNAHKPSSSQDSGQFKSSPSSSLLPSSCLRCSSCDPAGLCSDPVCSCSWTLSSRNPSSSSQPLMPLSFDMAPSYHIQRSMAREEWSQRPLVINNQSSVPSHYNRCSSTPPRNSHKYKRHERHHKSNVMGLSPIKRAGSALSQYRKEEVDEEDSLCHLYGLQESSDELLEGSYTQASLTQASKGFVRRRKAESVYNIDNIVIPMSLAKVEKLQYKNILTPSWRIVDSYSLAESKAQKREDCEEGQVEDLSDEIFAQRHLVLEQREKLRWTSWGKRKCCRRPTRSGSRLFGTVGTICISGESCVEWSSAQLDTDEQPSSDE